MILGRVPDPEQDAAGVTFAGPDAAVCENTTWASPRFSEAAGFRAVTTQEDGRIRFKRKKRKEKKKTPTPPALTAAGGRVPETRAQVSDWKMETRRFVACKGVSASPACACTCVSMCVCVCVEGVSSWFTVL